jgi:Integrase core domain
VIAMPPMARHPDFRPETTRIQPGEYRCIDVSVLILACAIMRTCRGSVITTCPTCGAITSNVPCPGWSHRGAGPKMGHQGHQDAKANMQDNRKAERMNRTVTEAIIKAFHYPDLDALRAHVLAFVQAYNFAKQLKAL